MPLTNVQIMLLVAFAIIVLIIALLKIYRPGWISAVFELILSLILW